MIQDIIDIGGHKVGTTETENGLSPEHLADLGTRMLCDICASNPLYQPPKVCDVDLFTTRLGDILPTLSNFNLRLELAPIQAYASANNFNDKNGMRWYLNVLVQYNVATKADIDKIAAVLAEQGITL